ncbi:MAG: hypothetical protein GF398_20035 [Chitinivibrionales bacterium]|nr:hypothetical protein [Chitinivibrionales bacterium]
MNKKESTVVYGWEYSQYDDQFIAWSEQVAVLSDADRDGNIAGECRMIDRGALGAVQA